MPFMQEAHDEVIARRKYEVLKKGGIFGPAFF